MKIGVGAEVIQETLKPLAAIGFRYKSKPELVGFLGTHVQKKIQSFFIFARKNDAKLDTNNEGINIV